MSNSRHKNIRMDMWDYTNPALYMVKICTQDRIYRFGEIDANNNVVLTLAGKMIAQEIDALSDKFSNVDVDYTMIMPNHVHMLIGINLDAREQNPVPLGRVIGTLKSRTTVRYNRGMKKGYVPPFNKRLWQAGYYETVVRNERMAEELRYYISNNPAVWKDDLEMTFVPESTTRVDATPDGSSHDM